MLAVRHLWCSVLEGLQGSSVSAQQSKQTSTDDHDQAAENKARFADHFSGIRPGCVSDILFFGRQDLLDRYNTFQRGGHKADFGATCAWDVEAITWTSSWHCYGPWKKRSATSTVRGMQHRKARAQRQEEGNKGLAPKCCVHLPIFTWYCQRAASPTQFTSAGLTTWRKPSSLLHSF